MVYDDVLQRNSNGELEMRTVATTGDTSTNKDDVFTRDENGKLCVRITGSGGGGNTPVINYTNKLDLNRDVSDLGLMYFSFPKDIPVGNYEFYYKVKQHPLDEVKTYDAFSDMAFRIKFNVSEVDGQKSFIGNVYPIFDGSSAIGTNKFWGSGGDRGGFTVFETADSFAVIGTDSDITSGVLQPSVMPETRIFPDFFETTTLKNIETKEEYQIGMVLGQPSGLERDAGFIQLGSIFVLPESTNPENSSSVMYDITQFDIEVAPTLEYYGLPYAEGVVQKLAEYGNTISKAETTIEFVCFDSSFSELGVYRAKLRFGYGLYEVSNIERTGILENAILSRVDVPDTNNLFLINKDGSYPFTGGVYVLVSGLYLWKNDTNKFVNTCNVNMLDFNAVGSSSVPIPEVFNGVVYGLKIGDTFTKAIANTEKYNILETFDLATDILFESLIAKGKYAIADTALKFPENPYYSDYGIEVRLNGAFAGGEGTNREFSIQLQRADGTVVSEKAVVKVSGNDLSKRSVVFETYTNGVDDPFIAGGIKIVVNNTSGQTLNLTGAEVLIKSRA